jgi:hypothetical protein
MLWLAFLFTAGLMVMFGDAGAGPHHTVLMYPAPHFIVAATIAAAIGVPVRDTLGLPETVSKPRKTTALAFTGRTEARSRPEV